MKVLQKLAVIFSLVAMTFAVVGCEKKEEAKTEEPAAEAKEEAKGEEAKKEEAPAEGAAEAKAEGDKAEEKAAEPEAPAASQ